MGVDRLGAKERANAAEHRRAPHARSSRGIRDHPCHRAPAPVCTHAARWLADQAPPLARRRSPRFPFPLWGDRGGPRTIRTKTCKACGRGREARASAVTATRQRTRERRGRTHQDRMHLTRALRPSTSRCPTRNENQAPRLRANASQVRRARLGERSRIGLLGESAIDLGAPRFMAAQLQSMHG